MIVNILRGIFAWMSPNVSQKITGKYRINGTWHDSITECLRNIRNGDEKGLATIYSGLVSTNPVLANECAHCIAQVLSRSTLSSHLSSLQRKFEAFAFLPWIIDWKSVAVESIEKVVRDEDDFFAVIALGTFHPNGYFRSDCLRHLERFGGRSLPFTLLLLNNWVAPIREHAFKLTKDLMQSASIKEVLSSVVCLLTVQKGQRRSESDFATLYEIACERLKKEIHLLQVSDILTQDYQSRRFLYQHVISGSMFAEENKLSLLTKETDEICVAMLAKILITNKKYSQKVVSLLSHRKSSHLRLLSLQLQYEQEKEQWRDLEPYLYDASEAVRDYAGFIFQKHGIEKLGLGEKYRDKVKKSPSPGAILGLGIHGEEADLALIQSFLRSDSSRMVKAALRAFTCLTIDGCDKILYEFMGDEKISKTAFTLSKRLRITYSSARCYEDFCQTDNPVLKRRFVQLICDGTAWDKLPVLLKLHQSGESEIRDVVNKYLWSWRFGYSAPTQGQVEKILNALSMEAIDPQIKNHIIFALKSSKAFRDLITEDKT